MGTMTFSLTDLLLIVLTVAAVIMVVYLIRLASQLARTATEVEELVRHINYMRPQFERMLDAAEHELGDIRKLTQRADGIVDDVGTVTHHASRLAAPALANISSLAVPLRYASAALTGAKIGMQVLRKRQKKKKDDVEDE
jgi:uncharacterized protein YoxC